MSSVGIAITGYPGTGKSLAGEILTDRLNAINIETGDVVREGASDYFNGGVSSLNSDQLGEYSTMRQEKDGGDYVIQDVFDCLENDEDFPKKTAIITGLRGSEAPKLAVDWFDRFLVVWIQSDFQTRLNRLKKRGRQDESKFTEKDLKRRDKRESDWGTDDVFAYRDVVIKNDGAIEDFERRLTAVGCLI